MVGTLEGNRTSPTRRGHGALSRGRRRTEMAGAEILDPGGRGGGGDVHCFFERLHLDLLIEVVDVDRLARYNVHGTLPRHL